MKLIIREYKTRYCQDQKTEMENLSYKSKTPQHENPGQYGYFINEYLSDIIIALDRFGVDLLVDLGAGVGHIVAALNYLGYQAKGIEIEKLLVEKSEDITSSVKQKDIFDLTKVDIVRSQVIYFWEPFNERELAKKFIIKLLKIMHVGQYIFYRSSGHTRAFLYEAVQDKKLKQLSSQGTLRIYKVLKH